MKTLLQLQKLDLQIDTWRTQEEEIPKQKERFEIQKKRLAAELEESDNRRKRLSLEQRECEKDIEQKQQQIGKYETQLLSVKKNAEYQSLLHEIEALKKQIAAREERIIALMLEIDEAKALYEEDKKRITDELAVIEGECRKIDAELGEAVAAREKLEVLSQAERGNVEASLLSRYDRIRKAKKTGPAAVPLNGESCSGCFMKMTPQVVNEILGGTLVHACKHCGRLLYHPDLFPETATS